MIRMIPTKKRQATTKIGDLRLHISLLDIVDKLYNHQLLYKFKEEMYETTY